MCASSISLHLGFPFFILDIKPLVVISVVLLQHLFPVSCLSFTLYKVY